MDGISLLLEIEQAMLLLLVLCPALLPIVSVTLK
jgi:hypothetical protein